MTAIAKILSGTGSWRAAGATEGVLHERFTPGPAPSTTLRAVPLPVPGRNR